MKTSLRTHPFRLGDWHVDPTTGDISRGDETARLEPKVTQVLLLLVRHEGRVVSKEEIFAEVWDGEAVTNDVLRRCIYSLRQTLGDDSDNPRYIRTLPRRGYTLVALVSDVADPPEAASLARAAAPPDTEPPPVPQQSRMLRLATGLIIVAIAGATWMYLTGASGDARLERVDSPNADEIPVLADGSIPTTAAEFFALGEQYVQQRGNDDYERAIRMYEKAIDADPEHLLAHAQLANAYALTVGGYFRDLERLDLAIEHATVALGIDPELPEAHKALGIAYAYKGWLSSAAREYERALDLRPGYVAAQNNLALVQVRRGELARGLGLQTQLRGTDFRRALYLNNLGHTYRLLEDYGAARTSLGGSLEIDPDNASAQSNLAIIDLIENDIASADDRLRRAMRMTPDDAGLIAVAGLAALAADDVDRALDLFETSIGFSADFTNPRAWLGIGYINMLRGDREAADSNFAGFYTYADESRRMRREGWNSHFHMAAIHSMLGEPDESFAELETAVANGFLDFRFLQVNPLFTGIKTDDRFDAIITSIAERVALQRAEVDEASSR